MTKLISIYKDLIYVNGEIEHFAIHLWDAPNINQYMEFNIYIYYIYIPSTYLI